LSLFISIFEFPKEASKVCLVAESFSLIIKGYLVKSSMDIISGRRGRARRDRSRLGGDAGLMQFLFSNLVFPDARSIYNALSNKH